MILEQIAYRPHLRLGKLVRWMAVLFLPVGAQACCDDSLDLVSLEYIGGSPRDTNAVTLAVGDSLILSASGSYYGWSSLLAAGPICRTVTAAEYPERFEFESSDPSVAEVIRRIDTEVTRSAAILRPRQPGVTNLRVASGGLLSEDVIVTVVPGAK
jgi:hypothetical protein